jgi:hypothetical protein
MSKEIVSTSCCSTASHRKKSKNEQQCFAGIHIPVYKILDDLKVKLKRVRIVRSTVSNSDIIFLATNDVGKKRKFETVFMLQQMQWFGKHNECSKCNRQDKHSSH